MALVNRSMSHSPSIQAKVADRLLVRINGTFPPISTIGEEKNSERAAEIKRKEIKANTSCSVFSTRDSASQTEDIFHLLIDMGEGVVESIERLAYDSGLINSQGSLLSKFPNAVLITHSHDDHRKFSPLKSRFIVQNNALSR